MFNQIRKSKFVQKIQEISPKFRWLSFSKKNKLDKSTTDYLETISGIDSFATFSDTNELEAMVRKQLKEEFPGIDKGKSYELLVDAVMNNIMKKQLQATDNLDIE